MPTQLKPGDVEAALITLLKTALADPAVQVRGLSSKDIDGEGSIVLRKVTPTVLVLWDGETLDPARDNTRTNYNAAQRYLAICFDQNLRSLDAERADAYGLVGQVRDILAGQKLTLADGAKTMPMQLAGTDPYQIDDHGSWYAVRALVPSMAQFTAKT
jgi:hypothetical protein